MGKILHMRKNAYFDSVTLMIVSKQLEEESGISKAIVGMGTELNLSMAESFGFSVDELADIGSNDFFVAVLSDQDMSEDELGELTQQLMAKRSSTSDEDYIAPTLASALDYQPAANLVLFSIPGQYVHREAMTALKHDKHIMIFSDNISVQEELELKQLGQERGLLVMGPDCGTAIINHTPLAFANAVRPGGIGIVGASGTGMQEVSVLIHKMGQGISQAIGTGGRDLSAEIGGIMMSMGIEALQNDPATEVIVLISKPPSPEVEKKIIEQLASVTKPVVVNFIAGEQTGYVGQNYFAQSLEEAARAAVKLVSGKEAELKSDQTVPSVSELKSRFKETQKYILGLYTGGTLAGETKHVLQQAGIDLVANDYSTGEHQSIGNEILDLGDDFFTRGKAHPMIDPGIRVQKLIEEANNPEVAVVMMDFVHGYGSNENPVKEMLPAIQKFNQEKQSSQEASIIVASICGTTDDPQDYNQAVNNLKAEGVVLFPSNYQAATFVAELMGGKDV